MGNSLEEIERSLNGGNVAKFYVNFDSEVKIELTVTLFEQS